MSTDTVYHASVSVVLPTYNHLRFLPKAMGSVLEQTRRDFELVVVNDGSTDGTRDYLDGLKDPRVRVIHQENKRLPEALNAGFQAARGQLLTWVSADNYCAPAFLETLSAALDAHPEAGFAYSAFASIDDQGHVTTIHQNQDLSYHKMLAANSSVASFMYRRVCQEKIGLYDPALEGAEDWDYWLRILEHFETVYVPVVLYYYRRHADTMSQRIQPKVVQSGQQVFRKAMERRRNKVDLLELYPTIRLCRDPRLAEFHAGLDFSAGLLRSPNADISVAVEVLRQARQMVPDSIEAASNLALAYARLGQWEAVLPLLRQMMAHGRNRNVLTVCQAIAKAQEANDPERLRDVQPFAPDKGRAELFQLEAGGKRVFVPANAKTDLRIASVTPGRRQKIAVLPHRNNISFMGEILARMRTSHDVEVVDCEDQEGISRALMSADVCWIEWATEFAARVTQQSRRCRTILRLHSFEAFVSGIQRIRWENVDDLIFVSPYIRDVLKDRVPDVETHVRTHVVPNCVDLDKFYFKDKPRGKKIAFVGALRPTKNIPFLLQCFREVYSADPEYTLHVAGEYFGDELHRSELKYYIEHIESQLGIQGRVVYYGHVQDISAWLDDKDFILSTSIREGHPVNVIEGMAKGLKPVVHNFPGARILYPSEWMFNTAQECRDIVLSGDFERERYRAYVDEHWSAERILPQIDALLGSVIADHREEAPAQAPRECGAPSPPRGPKVSVVMACRDAEQYLAECIDSVVHQTMPDWELHILDDGSTDGTRRIIEDYAGRDTRIKAYYFNDNKGPYIRRNYAIERAEAPFIVIQDADDIMCPNKLERLHAAIAEDDRLGVVGSFYRMFLDGHQELEHCEDVILATSHEQIINMYRTQGVYDFCPHGSAIIRKRLFEEIGPYDENPFGSDSFWLAKVVEYACRTGEIRLENIPEFLTLRRMHTDSQMGRLPVFDPRSRRVKFWEIRHAQMAEVIRRLNSDPTADVKAELRKSVCNDFVEKHRHLFETWESQPLTKEIINPNVGRISSQFKQGQFVRCITTCQIVERLAKGLPQTMPCYDLMRGLAYFAIGLYDQSHEYLTREHHAHQTPLAQEFCVQYVDHADSTWTKADRVEIVRKAISSSLKDTHEAKPVEADDSQTRVLAGLEQRYKSMPEPSRAKRALAVRCGEIARRLRLTEKSRAFGCEARQTGNAPAPQRAGECKPSVGRSKVTVITACHNCERFLPECLNSILDQTLPEWELFLLDDASTDGTRAVIEEYARRDPRIKPYYFDTNEGPYVRRNFAIERADSNFIVIQDGDDIMVPTKLEVLHKAISEDDSLAMVGSFYRMFLEDFKGLQYTELAELPVEHGKIAEKALTWGHVISHISAIIRKSMFERIGPYDENPFAADSFWSAKLAEYSRYCPGACFKNIPEPLTLYRIHGVSQTQDLSMFDPRNRRVRYRQYCDGKLRRIREKMQSSPGTDITQELRNCKCSDFLVRFKAQIVQWENEPLPPRFLEELLRNAVVSFNDRYYVSCVNVLNGVEAMDSTISAHVTGFDLLRGMAFYALDVKDHSRTYLDREIRAHGNPAAQAFVEEGFQPSSQVDVAVWCRENAGRYDLNLTAAQAVARRGEASYVGAASR